MDYARLRSEIFEGPYADACAPFVINYDAPKDPEYRVKDQVIVDILNAGEFTSYHGRFITARMLLAELNPNTAATILDKLEAAGAVIPAVKWAMRYITADGIDVGHPATRAMFEQLVTAGVLTLDEANAVIGLAAKTTGYAESVLGAPVSWADVSVALRGNAEFDPRG